MMKNVIICNMLVWRACTRARGVCCGSSAHCCTASRCPPPPRACCTSPRSTCSPSRPPPPRAQVTHTHTHTHYTQRHLGNTQTRYSELCIHADGVAGESQYDKPVITEHYRRTPNKLNSLWLQRNRSCGLNETHEFCVLVKNK